MPATYTLISSNVLTSSATSVTFSSIPATYTDLVLKLSARADGSYIYESIKINLNSDTSTNYSFTTLSGSGVSASSYGASSQTYGREGVNAGTSGANATSSTFSNTEIYIPNYAGSNKKPFSGFGVAENNSSLAYISTGANLWQGTSAITSITIGIAASGSFISGSSFYLYGISNA